MKREKPNETIGMRSVCEVKSDNGGQQQTTNKDDLHSLVDLLIDEAEREAQIIARIREAVERGEKDEVFNLAKELVSL